MKRTSNQSIEIFCCFKKEHLIISNVFVFIFFFFCESVCICFLCLLPIVNKWKLCRSNDSFSLILLKNSSVKFAFGNTIFQLYSFNFMEMVVQLKKMARGINVYVSGRASERKICAKISIQLT